MYVPFCPTNHVGLQGVFARQTNGTDYLIKNGHGDTSYTLNGDIVDNEYEYDAYGLEKETDALDDNPFRYCGEYYDDESGLIYLRNRYYDPSMGRFITEDPIMDGNNWYAYCGNNPINYLDPLGLWQLGDEQYPDYIQEAIRKYTIEWELCNSIDDTQGMAMAHESAESARALGDSIILREDWGAVGDEDLFGPDPNKTTIVIHHTVGDKSIQEIEEEHIDEGYGTVGYHFVISEDGMVYEGTPIENKGAHVNLYNTGLLGISLVGNFEPFLTISNTPSEEQLLSMIRLIKVLQDSGVVSTSVVNGHRDYNGVVEGTKDTKCPGQNLYDIINRLY